MITTLDGLAPLVAADPHSANYTTRQNLQIY